MPAYRRPTPRRLRTAAATVVLAAALGACGDGDDETTVQDRVLSTSTVADERPTCVNAALGFRVRYPSGWHTNESVQAPSCTYFHPEPFTLPEASEATDVAISVGVDDVAFDRVVAGTLGGPAVAEVVSREDVEIAARRGTRAETMASGEALLPRGAREYLYFVELGDRTLVASTLSVATGDYDAHKRVLDEMMRSLELLGS